MQTLAEDVLLLALNDDARTVDWQKSTDIAYAIGGALLMDLALGGCIEMSRDKLVVNDARSTGDELLDSALQLLASSNKTHDEALGARTQ